MALTKNRELDHYVDQQLRSYPVEAAKHVFKGAFVGLSASGHAQPLVAGNRCVGIAFEEADNTDGADGDLAVRVYTRGDFHHVLSGAAQTNVGDPVFASDDGTLTFTKSTNTYVGHAQDVPATGEIILRLDVERDPGAALTAKDASTVDGTYGAEEQAVIGNNRTRIEEIETALKREGILP
jgi:hypothetical protein